MLALNQSRILPTKGEIKKAPDSAHATACVNEKIKVDKKYVLENLGALAKASDTSRYVL